MRDWWYEVVQERYHVDQSQFEKLNETILKVQRTQESNQAEIDKLRKELVEEIRALRPIQDQAAESLKYVPVADIPRQANTAVLSIPASNIQLMGMPPTLRNAAEKQQK